MLPIPYFLTGLAVTASLLNAAQPQLVDTGYLTSLRAEAARRQPAALAGRYRATAAAHDIRAVRLWNDPMVGLGFMAADRMMRTRDGDVMVSLEQPLPKSGMFDARRRKAEAMARAETENANNLALTAGATAARDAIELALADESIHLQATQVEWLATMAENASQMAADPMASSVDALRLQTELAKERELLAATRRNRDNFTRQLNLTLGRQLDSPWPELRLPETAPPVPVAAAEVARIPYANPKVRAMKEMTAAAAAESRMAERERLPEVTVGVDTRLYAGGGDFRSSTVGIKMTLPWLNESSYQATIDAARSRQLAAERDVETMRREVAGMVLAAATEAANAAAQANAYGGDIHARAEQSTAALQAAWLSSKSPLTDLLDAERQLFAVRLEQRRFIAMQLAALEELRSLVPNNPSTRR